MNILKPFITVAIMMLCAATSVGTAVPDTINLAGLWRFQLDPMGFGMTPGSELYLSRLSETIMLPGSTDTGGKGVKTLLPMSTVSAANMSTSVRHGISAKSPSPTSGKTAT